MIKKLEKICKMAVDLTLVQAIELLSGKYVNEIVRNFAIETINKAPANDIKIYLLQLVQL